MEYFIFKLIKGSVILFIVLIIGLFLLAPFIHYSTTRGGEHTGFVTAIQRSGVIVSNYRVYFKTDNSSSQEDTYCVNRENKDLADKLRVANEKSEKITIQYEGVRAFGLGPCEGEEIIGIK